MRYLILSDIHGNWEALGAVLNHVRRKKYERVLFLGDAVGYGASPNSVIDWLRGLGSTRIAVRGNHDRVCAGIDSGAYFNQFALQAAHWTADRLEERNRKFLQDLPEGPVGVEDDLAICHGAPHDEDAYVFTGAEAMNGFHTIGHRVIFFGHTHVPSLFRVYGDDSAPKMDLDVLAGDRMQLRLDTDSRYLINPGSVGQPRDRDARAAYGIFDSTSLRFFYYRVPYAASDARQKIIRAGLPPMLGDRLLHGV